jgi:hypothetical protein
MAKRIMVQNTFVIFFSFPGLNTIDNIMMLLQFLSSQNPDTFASVDQSFYYGPILCDKEEISAKTKQCVPGYIESDYLCYKVLEEKMTKDSGEAACGVDNDYGVIELFGDSFTQKFMRLYTSGNFITGYFCFNTIRTVIHLQIMATCQHRPV